MSHFTLFNSIRLIRSQAIPLGIAMYFVTGGVHADIGGVNITGKVTASTCAVSQILKLVSLPTISIASLSTIGATAGEVSFDLALTGCGEGITTARPYFEPSSNISIDGRLQNSSGGATNVEVQILNASGTVIDLAKSRNQQNVDVTPIVSKAATVQLRARYFATGAAGPGVFSSSVNYTVDYN